jgi:hypothetical protein
LPVAHLQCNESVSHPKFMAKQLINDPHSDTGVSR